MAIKLRDGEEIKAQAQLHCSNYIPAGFWAFFCTPGAFASLFSEQGSFAQFLLIMVMGYLPLAYVSLKFKTMAYVITNERLYVEEGILAKSKKDLPLHKINDFEIKQGIFQRMYASGNVHVLTGNDKPTILVNIADVENFRASASALISTRRGA